MDIRDIVKEITHMAGYSNVSSFNEYLNTMGGDLIELLECSISEDLKEQDTVFIEELKGDTINIREDYIKETGLSELKVPVNFISTKMDMLNHPFRVRKQGILNILIDKNLIDIKDIKPNCGELQVTSISYGCFIKVIVCNRSNICRLLTLGHIVK